MSALLPTYPPYPFPLVFGVGDCVFDNHGCAFFDFYGGHCVCSTGHAHPKVAGAIARQAGELLFYVPMGAVLMNESIASQLKDEQLMQRALTAEAMIRDALRETCVSEIHGGGLLLGLRVPGRAKALKQHFEDARILVGGSSDPDVLRLMPPLNISDEAIAALAREVGAFSK